jgi:hypothetical protein
MRIAGWTAALGAGIALACADAPPDEGSGAPRAASRDEGRPPARAQRPLVRDVGRGARRCTDVTGWLDDPTPGGREVHAGPSAGSPVLGRIAEPLPEERGGWRAEFAIHGSQDGWLQVEGAGDDPGLIEGSPRRMYSGSGWIRGNGVLVAIQATQGFAGPRYASAIVLTAPNSLDGLELDAVVACQEHWVLARFRIRDPASVRYDARAVVSRDPLVVEAWATGLCNIQETTCDQAPGDRPDSVHPPASR